MSSRWRSRRICPTRSDPVETLAQSTQLSHSTPLPQLSVALELRPSPSHCRAAPPHPAVAMPSWDDGESSQDSLLSEFTEGHDLSPRKPVRVYS